jgi:tricorn protease
MSRQLLVLAALCALPPAWACAGVVGYYRQPAIHGDVVVFVSEGDLWKASTRGGLATRLTTHAGEEGHAAISPDGKTLAFTATYEGPTEVYTMPLAGGRPTRQTFDAVGVTFVGWAPSGELLYSTRSHSTLPNTQLVRIDLKAKGERGKIVPLAQAADGSYDAESKTLFFTRLPFQGSHTRRYKGGTAQSIWKYADGAEEAEPLTAKYAGTSKCPMWHDGRVYFVSDRDGTMNLWSMKPDGSDATQHTKHKGWDVASPSLSGGKVVYQLGADLWLHDLASGKGAKLDLKLESDFDQTRRLWVKKPLDYLSSAHLSHDGERVVLTARGQVFVVPRRKGGRVVQVSKKDGARHRDARFMPDGKRVLSLSDESGEVELWTMPANGVGKAARLTDNGKVLRWDAVPSPDGKYIAHHDKDQRLYLYDVAGKKDRLIDENALDDFEELAWSPDSKWLAYVALGDNTFRRIKLFDVGGKGRFVTTARYDSYSPAWSADGKWLYFLSDRDLKSVVPSPWGNYQPEPFLDRKTRIYVLALTKGQRFPFTPPDELHPKKEEKKGDKKEDKKVAKKGPPTVDIDFDGIEGRLHVVPVPRGNYSGLQVSDKALFWMSRTAGGPKRALKGLAIGNEEPEVKALTDDLVRYELSGDGKKLLIQKKGALYVVDASAAPLALTKGAVGLEGWSLSVVPREEWRQAYDEAWRLQRDYFYDRGMHGTDWKEARKKYRPLVGRVHNRAELSDVIAQMVSELSALHVFVRGGDVRKGSDEVARALLGARWERDDAAGGYRLTHIYQSDPDEPERASPLARPGVRLVRGDVITSINGAGVLDVADPLSLLRNKVGRQVLLGVKTRAGKEREVIVKPLTDQAAADLRYHEWEHTRRLAVEKASGNEFGYVHLRAMGGGNYSEWARDFYPVFNRKGLIIDVRHNRGGNIDSWVLSRLLRKPWFYWNQRVGKKPLWNMQFAFRGHVVVLVNEFTASDGEAFAEGAKRLGIAKVIGTRTWGGEIWLTGSNFLVDRGIATAAEFGVYGPEGAWLIEGHGVDPDVVVDNRPHQTFKGKDAQLEAAIAYLRKRLKEKPISDPVVPKFPQPGKPPAAGPRR